MILRDPEAQDIQNHSHSLFSRKIQLHDTLHRFLMERPDQLLQLVFRLFSSGTVRGLDCIQEGRAVSPIVKKACRLRVSDPPCFGRRSPVSEHLIKFCDGHELCRRHAKGFHIGYFFLYPGKCSFCPHTGGLASCKATDMQTI